MKFLYIIILIMILFYFFPILLIEGTSMFPTLKPKRLVLATRLFNRKNLKVGDIYIYNKPNDKNRKVVKRLVEVKKENGITLCYFLGDNPDTSYDSRHYGYVNAENIIAKLLWY